MKRKIKIRFGILSSLKLKHVLLYAGINIVLLTMAIFLYLNFSSNRKALAGAAATYNSSAAGGIWTVGSTWNGGVAPNNGDRHTANVYGNVSVPSLIQKFTLITLNSGKSFTSGTPSSSQNLAITDVTNFNVISGSVTVYGNFTLDGSTMTISSGSSLTVNGTLTLTGGATLNNTGTVNINGNISLGSGLNNYGIINVTGNIVSTVAGNAIITNTGNINIDGSASFIGGSKMITNPGGTTVVEGSLTVSANENLVVGTAVTAPPYANMIIMQNLIAESSGDIVVNKNGRLVVFGNVTDGGSTGSDFTINSGGQVYVAGNMTYSGSGSDVINGNSTNPYGFYTSGTFQKTGAGSTTTNVANENTLYNTNLTFYNFIHSYNNLLPVTIQSFTAEKANEINTLRWITTSQLNFRKFIIERSSDGKFFEKIGEALAEENTSSKREYKYSDYEAPQAIVYYRLNMTDLDGSFEYSQIAAIQGKTSISDLRIFPNPVRDNNFSIDLGNIKITGGNVSIRKSDGHEILNQSLNNSLSVINLPESTEKGLYYVTVSSGATKYTKKIKVE